MGIQTEPTIAFTITPDGDVVIEVNGVEGPECLTMTAEIEAQFGGVVDHQLTEDYNSRGHTQATNTVRQQRG